MKTATGNMADGFVGGLQNTWDGIKSQLTVKGYLSTLANISTLGGYALYGQMQDAKEIATNIPNYTAKDYQYATGFVLEKVAEIVVLKKVSRVTTTFGERLFLSEKFGITSTKFGSSAANAQGTLNQGGRFFKAGWSTGQNAAGEWGYKFRIGIGSNSANPNIARFHMYVPNSFVPNSFANPSIQVKRSLFGLN